MTSTCLKYKVKRIISTCISISSLLFTKNLRGEISSGQCNERFISRGDEDVKKPHGKKSYSRSEGLQWRIQGHRRGPQKIHDGTSPVGYFYSGDTGPVPEPLNGGYSAYHLSLPVSSFSSVVKR